MQDTVLGITVDLRALPYLLRLILWVFTERASTFGRFPVGSYRAGRRRAVSRGSVYSWSEKQVGVGSERRPLLCQAFRSERRAGVGIECHSSLARPSGQRLDHPWPVVRFFGPAQELRVVRNVVYWADSLLGSRSMRDPGFMNPTP